MISQFVLDGRNIITIGSRLLGVAGLIITAVSNLAGGAVPAFQVKSPHGNNWMITDRGGMGVGSGASAFGSSGQCLQSGGSSGALLTWGSCGGSGAATGSLLTYFDKRYVNTLGDTMTGALNILITGGNTNTVALEAPHTLSGSIVAANDLLRSSGALVVKTTGLVQGALTTRGILSGASLVGSNLVSCPNLQTSAIGALSCNSTSYQAPIAAGQGITFASNVVSLSSSFTGSSLEIFGTSSGRILHAQDTLTSSGGLVWEGAGSGASVTISNGFKGSGLTDCDDPTNSKVLWDTTTSRFSCGTDQSATYTPPSNVISGSGAANLLPYFTSTRTQSGASALFWTEATRQLAINGSVNKARLTVYGSGAFTRGLSGASLKIMSGAAILAGRVSIGKDTALSALDVTGTISGSTLFAGVGAVGTPAFSFNGDQNTGWYWIGADIFGAATGGAERLRIDASGNVGVGTTNTASAKLDVAGVSSGRVLHAQDVLESSGTLAVRGSPRIPHVVTLPVCDGSTACATGTGILFRVPSFLNNFVLSGAYIDAAYAGTTGTMTMQLRNLTQGKDMFTTLNLGSSRVTSGSTVTTANNLLTSGDRIVPAITAIHSTAAKGVSISLFLWPK